MWSGVASVGEVSAETGGIALARCRATCSICGAVKNQIDGTRERAERVVREAMERHVAQEHPACDDCGHIHAAYGCVGDPTPSDLWAGVSPAACDCDSALPPGNQP